MKSPGNPGLRGTNSASITRPYPLDDPDFEDAEEGKPPPVDADMVEAEHIMTDYISLLPKGSALLATQGTAEH